MDKKINLNMKVGRFLRGLVLGSYLITAAGCGGCGEIKSAMPYYSGTTKYKGKEDVKFEIYKREGFFADDEIDIKVYYANSQLLTFRDRNASFKLDDGRITFPDEVIEHPPSGERKYTLDYFVDEEGRKFKKRDNKLESPVMKTAQGKMREFQSDYLYFLSSAGNQLAGRLK